MWASSSRAKEIEKAYRSQDNPFVYTTNQQTDTQHSLSINISIYVFGSTFFPLCLAFFTETDDEYINKYSFRIWIIPWKLRNFVGSYGRPNSVYIYTHNFISLHERERLRPNANGIRLIKFIWWNSRKNCIWHFHSFLPSSKWWELFFEQFSSHFL